MLDMIRNDVTRVLVLVRIRTREEVEMAAAQQAESQVTDMDYHRPEPDGGMADEGEDDNSAGNTPPSRTVVNTVPKVGRNEPCPCGSGKKYKHCHGRLD